jgi:hypothetical protein
LRSETSRSASEATSVGTAWEFRRHSRPRKVRRAAIEGGLGLQRKLGLGTNPELAALEPRDRHDLLDDPAGFGVFGEPGVAFLADGVNFVAAFLEVGDGLVETVDLGTPSFV